MLCIVLGDSERHRQFFEADKRIKWEQKWGFFFKFMTQLEIIRQKIKYNNFILKLIHNHKSTRNPNLS